MFPDFVCSLLLFPLVIVGLGWPIVSRLTLDPAEKLCATVSLSLLAVYFLGFGIYVLALPSVALWSIPVLAVAGLLSGRRQLAAMLTDVDARAMLVGQLLVTGWCVGWLATVMSYSGGGWAGDWFEHWERIRFFRGHWPEYTKFLGFYPLPARPPLANIVAGALDPMTLTFAGYQVVTTLLNSIAFLPAALLARRFGASVQGSQSDGRGNSTLVPTAIALVALLLMLNPLFVENATFAWTKLITAFFILTGGYFFLRAKDPDSPRAAPSLCAASFAAGILAHYSAGPFVVVLAIAWFMPPLRRRLGRDFWPQTLGALAIGVVIVATWFGWSIAVYGIHTTLFSNSSVSVPEAHEGNQLVKVALNLRDTVVPYFLRPLDRSLIAQVSPWGYLRDSFFQLYQLNLLFAFGSIAWVVLIRELVRAWREHRGMGRAAWAWALGGMIFLGIAVHGARDTWGLVHICLQSVVVLGLAFLAARWHGLGRGWRAAVITGAAVDFLLGIALHFAVQNYALDRLLTPRCPIADVVRSYSSSSLMNLGGKVRANLRFLGDALGYPSVLVLALLGAILTLAIVRVTRVRPSV